MASDIAFNPRDHLGYRISLITRRWRAMIDAELEGFGLSEATWRPLLVLALRKGAPRQRELAEALQIGCPALVRLLDNLEAKKLIERLDVDDDRRAKQVLLTPEGRKLARRVHEIILDIEQRLLDGISPADLALADRIFGSIEQRLDEHDSPDTPA